MYCLQAAAFYQNGLAASNPPDRPIAAIRDSSKIHGRRKIDTTRGDRDAVAGGDEIVGRPHCSHQYSRTMSNRAAIQGAGRCTMCR